MGAASAAAPAPIARCGQTVAAKRLGGSIDAPHSNPGIMTCIANGGYDETTLSPPSHLATTIEPLLGQTSDCGCTRDTGQGLGVHTELLRAGSEIAPDGTLLLVWRLELPPSSARRRAPRK